MRKTNIGKLGIRGGQPFLIDKNSKTGILILEGYGLTETSPVISVNQENDTGKRLENF